MFSRLIRVFFAVLFLSYAMLASSIVFAYTTYQTTEGSLKLYFGEPGKIVKSETITEIDKPLTIKATFENSSDSPIALKLHFRTIETIEFSGNEPIEPDSISQSLEVPAKSTKTTEVNIVARPGTYTAHYPVHLDVEFTVNGETKKTNIVLVIETKIPAAGTPKNPLLGQIITDVKNLPLNILAERGGLFLPKLDTYRGVWNYDNKPLQILSVGFNSSNQETGASINRSNIKSRQSINMHPPYRGGIGNVGVEYRIAIPETKPITLSFFSAVRDVVPPETPSDGVTFRVLVNNEKVYEKHNAATDWVENKVDLTSFAGREIMLRLESDPGPKRNTNCDSCFWGDVLLFAGKQPVVLTTEEKQKLFAENLAAIQSGKSETDKTHLFKLTSGLTGAVTFGYNGFVDGVIGVGNAEKQIQFDGLRISCKGQPLGFNPTSINTGSWISKNVQNPDSPPKPPTKTVQKKHAVFKENQWAQDIEINGQRETLFFTLAQNGDALQFSIDSSSIDLIDRIEFGSATHHANRVYYGHGYCIEEPQTFVAGAGGHNLSTSHVGMDFENGISVLQASSFPPDAFTVIPDTKKYSLIVHPATTITLLPGLDGALDCAVRYRPICEKTPASGFETKAGRFVFDIWGGHYKQHTETIKHAIQYGLTDSLFIVHNWQRWGYDNRLPDIFPPSPRLGTLEDMQETLKLCNENGIQYGVHDNYIDFYPDAEEYNFDVTTFYENGQPRKAWNNYGIEAQSYQFRPDKVQKFLERNLDLLTAHLPMSTYFVDVFTSIPPVDFYDRDGNFHSRIESQAAWNKAFDTIRDRFSKVNKNFPSATTSSEAGMDSLIGHLDGADCQFMLLSSESGEFRIPLKCKQWSRVPWFDAVHHNTFSLHGVGYSNRYEAQRGRVLHGIDSDDYISSEILTGHALMTDWGSAKRGAVRKYWLAQDLIRHLSDKHITKVEFSDNNIHRQIITWNDGTTIFVNLDNDDWNITSLKIMSGKVSLPQFGFLATSDVGNCAIMRQQFGEQIIEAFGCDNDNKSTLYINARQKHATNILPIMPTLNSFKYLGGNKFSADFAWNTKGKVELDKNLCIFVHCTEKRKNWHQKLKEGVLGGGLPKIPTSEWKDKIVSDTLTMNIPDDLPAGRYYFVVGLYDQKGDGKRFTLMGFDTGSNRYAIGWLNIERKNSDNSVSNISMEPFEWEDKKLFERLLPSTESIDFGIVKTQGAFRIEIDHTNRIATVTPLPDEPATKLLFNLLETPFVFESVIVVKSVKAFDADGKELRDVPFRNENKTLDFTTQEKEFSYQITW
ncbi:MAG: DUF5696 domain-containing protein [Planctomycetaceae bacterium]|jgi:hypothetical protein|nr:DUF5696 domain-containing protein [Planctomycetaceae bacterium]